MTLILLLVFLANALVATSYFLTGANGGAAICCVGAIQTIINFNFERKNKPLPTWLIAVYAAMFIVANLLVFSNIYDIIALVAALLFVMGISSKSGKQYRLWSLANVALWIGYDLLTLSFGPLVTHCNHRFRHTHARQKRPRLTLQPRKNRALLTTTSLKVVHLNSISHQPRCIIDIFLDIVYNLFILICGRSISHESESEKHVHRDP